MHVMSENDYKNAAVVLSLEKNSDCIIFGTLMVMGCLNRAIDLTPIWHG